MMRGLLSRLLSNPPEAKKRLFTVTRESRLNSGFFWEPAVGFEPTACCLRKDGCGVRSRPAVTEIRNFSGSHVRS
jgi:hypothetical protein